MSEGEEDEDEECDLDKEDQVSLSSRESSAHVTGAGFYKEMVRVEMRLRKK